MAVLLVGFVLIPSQTKVVVVVNLASEMFIGNVLRLDRVETELFIPVRFVEIDSDLFLWFSSLPLHGTRFEAFYFVYQALINVSTAI